MNKRTRSEKSEQRFGKIRTPRSEKSEAYNNEEIERRSPPTPPAGGNGDDSLPTKYKPEWFIRPRTPSHRLAAKLLEILKKHKRQGICRNLPQWPNYFKDLLEVQDYEQVRSDLEWYDFGLTQQMVPKCHNARSWCEEYPRIHDARIRLENPEPIKRRKKYDDDDIIN